MYDLADYPHLHFGQLIRRRLKSKGMSLNDFAKQIDKHPDHIADYLDQRSFDVLELAYISKVLQFDFFRLLDWPADGVPPLRYKKRMVVIEMEEEWAIDILEQHGITP